MYRIAVIKDSFAANKDNSKLLICEKIIIYIIDIDIIGRNNLAVRTKDGSLSYYLLKLFYRQIILVPHPPAMFPTEVRHFGTYSNYLP